MLDIDCPLSVRIGYWSVFLSTQQHNVPHVVDGLYIIIHITFLVQQPSQQRIRSSRHILIMTWKPHISMYAQHTHNKHCRYNNNNIHLMLHSDEVCNMRCVDHLKYTRTRPRHVSEWVIIPHSLAMYAMYMRNSLSLCNTSRCDFI